MVTGHGSQAPPYHYLGFTRARWYELFESWGEKPYRTKQIMRWLHHRLVDDFSEMTDIAGKIRERLASEGDLREPEVTEEFVSKDGTRKWLVRSASGSLVETVFIPEENRGTLCVSSQAGCALDCSFCSTGKQGFDSNLMVHEIIGQLRIAMRALAKVYPDKGRRVTNVVMMGMGEPLLNTANVIPAIDLMVDDLGYGISKRKVTVSTAGVVPGIRALGDATDVSLAISLHAPDDELRNRLVPINRKYPLAELLDACSRYARNLGPRRTLTVEYTLIGGVNDSPDQAARLSRLLRGFPCKINLIPFNRFPGTLYRRPSMSLVREFQDRLVKDGYSVTVRTTRGEDIQAACGQLVGRVADRTRRQERYKPIAVGYLA